MEEREETFFTGVHLPQKTKTLELKPESKSYSSTLEKKKEKPVFLSQLLPTTVSTGTTARLTARISGFPRPTVQWSRNGKVIKSSSTYQMLEEKDVYTLVIDQVTYEYEGEYSCTAANKFGQTTCTTYLEVKTSDVRQAECWVEKMFSFSGQPPTFTIPIQAVRCLEGSDVSFHYKVSGEPKPHVQWFKGAFQIQVSRNCLIIAGPDSSGLMTFKNVKLEDDGLYTCKASNRFGDASCSAALVVSRKSESDAHLQEQLTVVQKKRSKVSVTEQVTESRLYQVSLPGQDRAATDQMVYTIGTVDRQIIPSEQVSSLTEVDISAATVQREQLTQQAAVLQAHEIEERVSVVPSHPPQVLVIPAKQFHVAAFTSSVEESQDLMEQHCSRIQSPEVIELRAATEMRSKVMSAVAEELTSLSAISTEQLPDSRSTTVRPTSEPTQLVSGCQVESQLAILKEQSKEIPKPEQEKSYKVKEGIKILYSSQSSEKITLTEHHTTELATIDIARQASFGKEESRPILASISEHKNMHSKESSFPLQTPGEETAHLGKDQLFKAALMAEDKQLLQTEATQQLPILDAGRSIPPQLEEEPILHLQVITDQDLLPSEVSFTCEKPVPEQAGCRKSPTLLYTVSQDKQRTLLYEHASEFNSKAETISVPPQKEAANLLHLQSTQPVETLSKEGILVMEVPEQQEATQRQEKAKMHAATLEEKRELRADYHKDLDLSVTGVHSRLWTEPRPQSILQLSFEPTQLPKETPLTSDVKQQRALVQKEDRWDVTQVTTVADSHTLEERHTDRLADTDKITCQTAREPRLTNESVQVEKTAISTESSVVLRAAEQDFAVQIQEGQSVRQSIVMDEKQVLRGEFSQEITRSECVAAKATMQPRLSLMLTESRDSMALPKELTFMIQTPKHFSLNIRHQLRQALQSAVASEQPLLLAEIAVRLQAVDVQEVKIQREPKLVMLTYMVTTAAHPLEITLAFEGNYPQTADFRTELQAALHSILYQEAKVLPSEQPGTMQLDKPQRLRVSSAHSKESLSSVVETVRVAENAQDFGAIRYEAAAFKTQSRLKLQSAAAEEQVVVQSATATVGTVSSQVKVSTESHETFKQFVQMSSQEVRLAGIECQEKDTGVAAVTATLPSTTIPMEQVTELSIQKEFREEVIQDEVTVFKTEHEKNPTIVTCLQDVSFEENCEATLSAKISYVSKVNWFFNGELVKPGEEFKCLEDNDTYTLVINNVVKERHEGQYVCQAENDAGRTTTSSRLTVVSRGLTIQINLSSIYSPITLHKLKPKFHLRPHVKPLHCLTFAPNLVLVKHDCSQDYGYY